MAVVNEVETRFRVNGAKEAQRADRNVRDSIQETSKTARSERGTIDRWMDRHQTALKTIGAATAGVLAGIISASPTMRAELAGVRVAFSLFADTVVNDVLPSGRGLVGVAFDLEQSYRELPDPLRETASALFLVGGAAALASFALGPVAVAAVIAAGAYVTLRDHLGPAEAALAGVAGAAGFLARRVHPVAGAVLFVAGVIGYLENELGPVETGFLVAAAAAAALLPILGPVGLAILGLIIVAIALYEAWQNNWLGIRGIVSDSADWISDRIAWLNKYIHADTDERLDMIKDLYLGFKDWLGDIGSASGQMFRDAFNAAIPSSVTIPSVTVAGRTFGGQNISIPRLRFGGEIESGGLARLHEGETVIPSADVNPIGESGRGGGPTVIFESGAIQVNDAGSPRRTAETTADEVSQQIRGEFGTRR